MAPARHQAGAEPKDDHDAAKEGDDEEGDEDRAPLGGAHAPRRAPGRWTSCSGPSSKASLENAFTLAIACRVSSTIVFVCGQLVLGLPRVAAQLAPEEHGGGDHEGQGAEHDRGQLSRGQRDHGDAADEEDGLAAHLRAARR
jgi:hypothetical protein